jgi:hypothetical protein
MHALFGILVALLLLEAFLGLKVQRGVQSFPHALHAANDDRIHVGQATNRWVRKALVAVSVSIIAPTLTTTMIAPPHAAMSATMTNLKAVDLISSDLNEDKAVLENIVQILKLDQSLVDSKDYQSIRTSTRSGSVTSLRKTCKQLIKVLNSEEQQAAFTAKYDDMIDKFNDFDSLITKRLQKAGVPEGKDDEVQGKLNALLDAYAAMLREV